ncbi:hypothetical protein EDB85DRAFT_1873322, partial [Lactarius pseudohatsudake]
LFGCLFNWTLYGTLCVQIYVYSYNFPKDPRSLKLLAYFIFVLETVQTALTGADLYYWFVTGFGNVERLGNSHFTPVDVPIMTGVSSLAVQGYFCYRIWVLMNRRSWICWVVGVVCIPNPPRILQAPDVFLSTECGDPGRRRDVAEHHSQCYAHFYRNVLSYAVFSR